MDNNNQNMMQNAQTSQPQQNAQPQQYQAQPQQYQAQPQQYQAQQPQYQAQPPQYQAQPPQYQAQQPQYQAQQPQYQAQPPQYQAQQPQYQAQQPYGQQPYGQPYTQQPYGQPYAQSPKAPKQPSKLENDFKEAIGSLKSVFEKKGISLFWLAGLVAAMMFIFAPFMNIAAIHVNQKVSSEDAMDIGDMDDFMDMGSDMKVSVKVKAADGFTMFELSKLGGTVDSLIDTAVKLAGPYGSMISKDMLVDSLDMLEDEMDDYLEEFEDDYSVKVRKSSVKEVFGTLHLVLKGRAALLITPFVLILCGIGMFLFTLINKKVAKIVCSAIPLACLLWIMLCSSHFFSIMGIGVWVILVAGALGIVSAIMDKSAC